MQYLGYILCKNKIKEKFDYIKVVNDPSEIEEGKPFIIVGIELAKDVLGARFSWLHRKLDNGVRWTFGRTEKRDIYEEEIKDFYNEVLEETTKKIRYKSLDILNFNYNILKRLLILCNSSKRKYIYIWNDIVYFLCDETVFGISLRMARFCGCNVDKIVGRIYKNPNHIVCDTEECISYRLRQRFKRRLYVIPYFNSLIED